MMAMAAKAAKTELEVGDVVRLNSGTLRMTVAGAEGLFKVTCRWHGEWGDLLVQTFDSRELTLIAARSSWSDAS